MIDFKQKYESEIKTLLLPLIEKVKTCESNLEKAEKRLNEQKELSGRDEQQRQKLKSLSDSVVIDDQNAFEKYKVSLKKAKGRTETTTETIETIENIILQLEKELLAAQDEIDKALSSFASNHVSDCKSITLDLLSQIADTSDNWIDTFKQLAKDYGATFKVLDYGCQYVTALQHNRFRPMVILPKVMK